MAGLGMQIAGEDIILLGRVTYQQWSAYWPNSTDRPYASHINNIPQDRRLHHPGSGLVGPMG